MALTSNIIADDKIYRILKWIQYILFCTTIIFTLFLFGIITSQTPGVLSDDYSLLNRLISLSVIALLATNLLTIISGTGIFVLNHFRTQDKDRLKFGLKIIKLGTIGIFLLFILYFAITYAGSIFYETLTPMPDF